MSPEAGWQDIGSYPRWTITSVALSCPRLANAREGAQDGVRGQPYLALWWEDEVRQEARTANRSETCASKPRRRTPNGAALLPLLRTMFPNGSSGRGPRTERRPSLASRLLSPPVFGDTERSWPPSPKARRARHGLPDQHGWYIFRSRMDPGETSSTCAPFGGVRFRSLPKE
jgi:hypothetical protein